MIHKVIQFQIVVLIMLCIMSIRGIDAFAHEQHSQYDNLSKLAIRKGMPVRLGGHFYGKFNTSIKDETLSYLMTDKQIDWVLQNFDVLSTSHGVTPKNVRLIKKINPNFRYYYATGVFATALIEPVFKKEIMSSWTLKLNDGSEAIGGMSRTANKKWHYMDLRSRAWAYFFNDYYSMKCHEYNADGVVVDELMWGGYWGPTTGLPMKINLLKNYNTREETLLAPYEWLKNVTSFKKMQILNQAWWDEAQQYLDGVWGEYAMRPSYGDKDFHYWVRKNTWKGIVDNLEKHTSKDRTYIFAAWYDRDNLQQFIYVLTTYLMGNSGRFGVFQPMPIYGTKYNVNLSGYSIDTVIEEVTKYKHLLNVKLGEPLDSAKKIKGLTNSYWKREFSNGFVLCNPSNKKTSVIKFDKKYLDVQTGNAITIVTLPPLSGRIILNIM